MPPWRGTNPQYLSEFQLVAEKAPPWGGMAAQAARGVYEPGRNPLGGVKNPGRKILLEEIFIIWIGINNYRFK
jgi:hypothetical protein